MRRLALACLAAAALAGCDRVPLDSGRSELLLADPDLGVVFLDPNLRVRFVPTGPAGAVALRVRDKDIAFDSTDGAFVYERVMDRGLNTYPYELRNSEGEVVRDTFYAVFLAFDRTPLVGADEGVPRADAARAAFPGGRALVSGGVGGLAAASVQTETGPFVAVEEIPLLRPRAAHTATEVPGGVLLMGGGAAGLPEVASGFVREPEFVGEDGVARPVAVADDAFPARAGHVAKAVEVGGQTYVTLVGGRTPTANGTALSGTVDVYRVLPDGASVRLVRLTPDGGAGGFPLVDGPALGDTGPRSAVVTGLGTDGAGVTIALEWASAASGALPFSIDLREVGGPRVPRADAAAAALGEAVGGGLVVLSGGRDGAGDPVRGFEVYAAGARRTFRIPERVELAVPRADHVATIFGGARMVVSGGRASSGGPLVAREAFTF